MALADVQADAQLFGHHLGLLDRRLVRGGKFEDDALDFISLLAQQVEGNVIYPHIVGSSVGLPAYVTLGGVFLGGAVAGIPGMVLIIPVISVIYQLLKEAVEHRTAAPGAVKTPPVS